MENILAFLEQEKPDILALQEVYNSQDSSLPSQYRTIEVLSHACGQLSFSHFAAAFLDKTPYGFIEQGNAIFSRFPIVKTACFFGDIRYAIREDQSNIPFTPRNLQQVTLLHANREINIFNTQGIWGRDGKDNPRRLAFSELIVEQIRDKPHVLLCGDFNVQMSTESIALIERHLSNAFLNRLTSSFNMRRKNDPCFATSVVDSIFYSRDLILKEAYTSPHDVSDHLPLVTKLEIAL